MWRQSSLDPSEGRHLYGTDPAGYSAGRPDYPDRVYELLVTRCGLRAGSRVVEIGPGTGLCTRRLLAARADVTAVEPNTAMADHLRDKLKDEHPHVIVATFAPLEDGAFDLAVAATSFHWVDPRHGYNKVRRVVRSYGWVAVWWMLFEDPTQPDELRVVTERLLGVRKEPGRIPFEIDEMARRYELHAAGFVNLDSELIRSEISMTAERVRALYATMAVVLRRPPDEQVRLLDELEAAVHSDYGGHVRQRLLTALYTGRNP